MAVMLDLSAAFDTVDHQLQLVALEHWFAVIGGVPLTWFRSFPADLLRQRLSSEPFTVGCSVPQSSVLGHVEFISYTDGISELFDRHQLHHRLFADDKQLYDAVTPVDVDAARARLSACITEVGDWCASRRFS